MLLAASSNSVAVICPRFEDLRTRHVSFGRTSINYELRRLHHRDVNVKRFLHLTVTHRRTKFSRNLLCVQYIIAYGANCFVADGISRTVWCDLYQYLHVVWRWQYSGEQQEMNVIDSYSCNRQKWAVVLWCIYIIVICVALGCINPRTKSPLIITRNERSLVQRH